MLKLRLVAGLLLASMVCPVVAAVAAQASGSSCAMCSKTCCCAPGKSPGACRLSRPCGQDQAPLTPAQTILKLDALMAPRTEFSVPNGRLAMSAPSPAVPLDRVLDPPERPPRVSLSSIL